MLATGIARWQNMGSSSFTSAPDILLEVVRAARRGPGSMSFSAYKYGGRHREYCQCPMCGENGGKHTLGCVCPACGSLGGTHEVGCRCPFCNQHQCGAPQSVPLPQVRRDRLSCVQRFTNLYRSVTNLYAYGVADVFTYVQLSDEQRKAQSSFLDSRREWMVRKSRQSSRLEILALR